MERENKIPNLGSLEFYILAKLSNPIKISCDIVVVSIGGPFFILQPRVEVEQVGIRGCLVTHVDVWSVNLQARLVISFGGNR